MFYIKTKTSFTSKSICKSLIKKTKFWQNYVQNYQKGVEKIAYKPCVTYKDADRIYAEIVLTCMMQTTQFYLSNFTSIT